MLRLFWLTSFFSCFAISYIASAQTDGQSPIDPDEINVIKSYEPILADAVRIGFLPALPGSDSQPAPPLPIFNDYNLPPRFLAVNAFEPPKLKPLAYKPDKSKQKNDEKIYHAWLKAGYGNYNTPLIDFAVSNGKSKKWQLGANGSYIGSNNKNYDFQKYSQLGAAAYGKRFLKQSAVAFELGYKRHTVHYYGYDHADTTLHYTADSLRQTFNNIAAHVGIGSFDNNNFNYDFRLGFHRYFDRRDAAENNIILNGSTTKSVGKTVGIGALLHTYFSGFSHDTTQVNDLLFALTPHLTWQPSWGKMLLGATGIFANDKFYPYPYIDIQGYVLPNQLTIYGVWNKIPAKNNYMNLSTTNPFVAQNLEFVNAIAENRYVGVKGNIGKKMTFNLRGGQILVTNQPLFLSLTDQPHQYTVVYDSLTTAFHLQTELGLRISSKVEGLAKVTYNRRKTKNQAYAWHLPDLELTFTGQYRPIEKLNLRTDIFAFSSTNTRLESGAIGSLKGTIDLNLAADYQITQNFAVFCNLNNIANRKYQRYAYYPTYGFNVVGGISLRF